MPTIHVNIDMIVNNSSREELAQLIRRASERLEIISGFKLNDTEMDCLKNNGKIETIKMIRQRYDMSLRDAYDIVTAAFATMAVKEY